MAKKKSGNVTIEPEDIADEALEVEAVEVAEAAEDALQTEDIPVEDSSDVENEHQDDTDVAETEAEDVSLDNVDDELDVDAASEAPSDADSVIADTATDTAPRVETRVIEKRAGFFPTVLGGIVAAGIGVGVSETGLLDDVLPSAARDAGAFEVETRTALEAQAASLAALESQVAGSATQADVDALAETAANAGHTDALQAEISGFSDRLLALEARMNDLEKSPITEGVSSGAIAAYERELAALQESVATQRAEIESIAADAAHKEAEAAQVAQATLARAALTRVISAIETGTAFDGALTEFAATSGAQIPEVLSIAAVEGVSSLADLQADFPDVARASLAASRSEAGEDSGGAGSLGTFFARQLGARSVTPREGSDPDAVLSRAEAAVRDGRLNDALAEIETLPEAGRVAAAAWVEAAMIRKDAQAAAEALSARLEQN